jgi:radical SAM superfamily enzyme YgiQ (UPF0313 family)
MCTAAGFNGVFIGVESPNKESLAETMKRQNLRVDLAAEITKVVAAGLMVNCGMIVGFDHDDPSIFERQAEFIAKLPTPMLTLGLLVAPASTPLYARMLEEGRIVSDSRLGAGQLLETNIRPKLMSDAQLKAGMRWLLNRVFSAPAFGERLLAFARTCAPKPMPARIAPISPLESALAKRIASYGPEDQALLNLMQRLVQTRPDLRGQISRALLYYAQIRYMLTIDGLWSPDLARQDQPLAA